MKVPLLLLCPALPGTLVGRGLRVPLDRRLLYETSGDRAASSLACHHVDLLVRTSSGALAIAVALLGAERRPSLRIYVGASRSVQPPRY